jgi:stage II sporulation protein P
MFFIPFCMAFSGCGDAPKTTATAGTPTATPDIFGEVSDSGDIKINSSVLSELKPQVYSYAEAPTILIYHTHATEAFLQDENYTYTESSEWRTEDNEKNIVHVGEVLKTELEAAGYNVIHDTANVEPPELTSAYSRSLEVMKKYEGVDIYIDLHRNAADVNTVKNNTVTADGKPCAKMFFVVGTGIGTYKGEYDTAPDWRANYTFAASVMNEMSSIAPGMMKPIRTKVGRYNHALVAGVADAAVE